jgi:hypothetical protein
VNIPISITQNGFDDIENTQTMQEEQENDEELLEKVILRSTINFATNS